MIKKVVTVISVLSFILLIAGCSSKNTNNSTGGTPTVKATPSLNTIQSTTPTPIPTETIVPATVTNSPMASVIKSGNRKVPILYYHAVNEKIFGIEQLIVRPTEFDQQMKYLKDNGYQTIDFKDLEHLEDYQKPVIITLDDGYEDNYTNAYTILKKYGLRATIFLPANYIDKGNYLKTWQVKEMLSNISFQSHTVSHRELDKLPLDQVETELSQSKEKLSSITGQEVYVIAYPVGKYNKNVLNITKKYYKYGVRSGGGMYYYGEQPDLEMKRIYVERYTSVKQFKALLGK